ncbi:MAG: nitronate monooxygenase [Thermomicrobiales bacterium]|nr:nitronate monooxygenase [Thermomicrobiales bacterium]
MVGRMDMGDLLELLGIETPIVQAPMAGTATPKLAIAVSNAGALGSIGIGTSPVDQARAAIREIRSGTDRPFHVNLFCDPPANENPVRDEAWLEFLAPQFHAFGAVPPESLVDTSQSFLGNDVMLAMILEERPPVVSFHFGLPEAEVLAALKNAGIILIGCATNLEDARVIEAAGLDAVIAQGIEAGGHRGLFDLDRPDEKLGTFALTRLLARELTIPVISAGGVMDGAGIAACLALGAQAAQLGTAFIGCPESAASDDYRRALLGPDGASTTHTAAISGRPARGMVNHFMRETARPDAPEIPDYPLAYHAYKSLSAAALAAGNHDYGTRWAGQGAMLSRSMPAAELVETLKSEMSAARTRIPN